MASKPLRLPVRVVRGDVRDVPGQAMIMGWRNPLRPWVKERVTTSYRMLEVGSQGSSGTEVMRGDELPWPMVGVMTCRKGGRRIGDDLFSLVHELINKHGCSDFVVMPLSCRKPEEVAFGTLMAFWFAAHFAKGQRIGRELRLTLVSFDGFEAAEALLEDGQHRFDERLMESFKRIHLPMFWPDINSVRFDWDGGGG